MQIDFRQPPSLPRGLAIGPLFPVLGAAVAVLVHPSDPLQSVVLRWAFTVPGYAVGIIGVLGLAGRERLRGGGLRSAVELALFLAGCLMMLLKPGGLVLGAATARETPSPLAPSARGATP